jgi:hypothetical protein
VEAQGGQVLILPYVQDHSTTGIIERIRQNHDQANKDRAPHELEPAAKARGRPHTKSQKTAAQKEAETLNIKIRGA